MDLITFLKIEVLKRFGGENRSHLGRVGNLELHQCEDSVEAAFGSRRSVAGGMAAVWQQ